jgi:hypothetical protein
LGPSESVQTSLPPSSQPSASPSVSKSPSSQLTTSSHPSLSFGPASNPSAISPSVSLVPSLSAHPSHQPTVSSEPSHQPSLSTVPTKTSYPSVSSFNCLPYGKTPLKDGARFIETFNSYYSNGTFKKADHVDAKLWPGGRGTFVVLRTKPEQSEIL